MSIRLEARTRELWRIQMDDSRLDEPQITSAMEQLATDPSDRKRFLKAVGGTAAAGAFALFLAACGSSSNRLELDDLEQAAPRPSEHPGRRHRPARRCSARATSASSDTP